MSREARRASNDTHGYPKQSRSRNPNMTSNMTFNNELYPHAHAHNRHAEHAVVHYQKDGKPKRAQANRRSRPRHRHHVQHAVEHSQHTSRSPQRSKHASPKRYRSKSSQRRQASPTPITHRGYNYPPPLHLSPPLHNRNASPGPSMSRSKPHLQKLPSVVAFGYSGRDGTKVELKEGNIRQHYHTETYGRDVKHSDERENFKSNHRDRSNKMYNKPTKHQTSISMDTFGYSEKPYNMSVPSPTVRKHFFRPKQNSRNYKISATNPLQARSSSTRTLRGASA